MKVGIVTLAGYENYGNRLQNYALSHILQTEFGCRVVSLVGVKEKRFHDGRYRAWFNEHVAEFCCAFPALAKKRFGIRLIRWTNFKKWSKRIPTKFYYGSNRLPQKVNAKYDMFLVGSDQVWNYHFASSGFYNFFLTFSEEKKRAAVSASFGIDEIPDEWKQTYIEGLKGFPYISVREETGQKIVKSLLGRDVPVLIDPTMMLSKEQWLNVSKKPKVDCERPYVLKYYLGDESQENGIDDWARKNGYEIYELLNEAVPDLYSAGPGEFITLISNAALVCSDSFHCIVFSIIFSKPFIAYARRGKEDYMLSRLKTLLCKFGLQHRWSHLLPESQYLDDDYGGAEKILAQEQENFRKYLEKVLHRS